VSRRDRADRNDVVRVEGVPDAQLDAEHGDAA
jgi:hypothetical protein